MVTINVLDKILSLAAGEIGYTESPKNSNKTKYGQAYGLNRQPWCVMFQWWLFKQADAGELFYGGGKTASCGELKRYAAANRQWVTSGYKRGDLVIFDFSGNVTVTDHIGIVESVNGKVLTTIEGNTSPDDNGSQSNGGAVCRKKRDMNKVKVVGAFRPDYGGTGASACASPSDTVNIPMATIRSGSRGEQVKTLQRLLNSLGYDCGAVDGIAGAKTVAAVKTFQKARGLSADGIAGIKTWTELLGA